MLKKLKKIWKETWEIFVAIGIVATIAIMAIICPLTLATISMLVVATAAWHTIPIIGVYVYKLGRYLINVVISIAITTTRNTDIWWLYEIRKFLTRRYMRQSYRHYRSMIGTQPRDFPY